MIKLKKYIGAVIMVMFLFCIGINTFAVKAVGVAEPIINFSFENNLTDSIANTPLTSTNMANRFVDGVVGKGVTFGNKQADQLTFTNTPLVTANGVAKPNFTIQTWFYSKSSVDQTIFQIPGVLEFKYHGQETNKTFYFCLLKSTTGGTAVYADEGANIPINTWNLFTARVDNGKLSLFVNGTQRMISSSWDVKTPVIDYNLPGPLYLKDNGKAGVIGYNKTEDVQNIFGVLDEFQIYNYPLTSAQVLDSYNALSPVERLANITSTSLDVVFKAGAYPTNPLQNEFTLEIKNEGTLVPITVTSFVPDKTNNKITFNFNEITSEFADLALDVKLKFRGSNVTGILNIKAKHTNTPPVCTNVQIENLMKDATLGGAPHVRGTLMVNYTFTDADNQAEGETLYQWMISNTANGTYSDLQGIKTKTIIITKDYIGKFLKCKVTPKDIDGSAGQSVLSSATEAVVETIGNPLTDWMVDAYGVSHHFLDQVFNLSINGKDFYKKEDKWKFGTSWSDFIKDFNVTNYVDSIEQMGAKFILLTIGQNDGYFCAPSATYDKYMRQEGYLGATEKNPMTSSIDLPQKIMDEIKLRGIDVKFMLYLPSSPPHSASRPEQLANIDGFVETRPFNYSADISVNVFKHPRAQDAPSSDRATQQEDRRRWEEMITEWALRYQGDLAGWWFDGFYKDVASPINDMSRDHNISSFANAAKAGNPNRVICFNSGFDYNTNTNYADYNAGERPEFQLPAGQTDRWNKSANGNYAQNYTWGALGQHYGNINKYGRPGLGYTEEQTFKSARDIRAFDGTLCFDLNLNAKGQIDAEQVAHLVKLKAEMAKISITSSLPGATLLGGGTYNKDDAVTVKATLKSGDLFFDSWKDGSKIVSRSASYSFKYKNGVDLVANYVSKSYSLDVNTEKPASDAESSANCQVTLGDNGLTLAFTATTGANSVFDGWYYNSKRISSNPSYTMTLGSSYLDTLKMNAKFRASDSSVIRFVRDGNISISTQYLSLGSTIKAPTAYKSGYTFLHWLKKGDNTPILADAVINIESGEAIYEAVFSSNNVSCAVQVTGGTLDKTIVKAFDVVTATSNIANFGYWTIDGVIVSYNPIYHFTADGNLTIVANEKKAGFVETPSVYLSKNSQIASRESVKVYSPMAYIVSGVGYEIVEKGLLLIGGENSEVDIDTTNVRKITTFTNTNGQLTGTFINVPTNFTVRAYVVYKLNGSLFVEYSLSNIIK